MVNVIGLVDTTILVDFFRGHENASAWLHHFADGELTISVVTAAELVAGCINQREQRRVEKDLALFPMTFISSAISATAWEWYCQHRLRDGVGFLDCLIGASAYHLGVTVYTLNEKHFRPFPDLKVERPY